MEKTPGRRLLGNRIGDVGEVLAEREGTVGTSCFLSPPLSLDAALCPGMG